MEMSAYDEGSSQTSAGESQLWVDKYKPSSIRQIIGQQGDKSNAKKLQAWLQQWRDNYGKKPACKHTNGIFQFYQYYLSWSVVIGKSAVIFSMTYYELQS
jgi:hypothetical protein